VPATILVGIVTVKVTAANRLNDIENRTNKEKTIFFITQGF
jgi:hypothetical protein